MKRNHMTGRSIARTAAAVWLLTFLPVAVVWAGIQPEPFRTGLFGLTAGQSVRISVVNAGAAGSIINLCMHVRDAAGTLLFEADIGPLSGGVGTLVDFGGPPTGAGARTQVWAEVIFEHGSHPPDPAHPPDPIATLVARRAVLVTLEVFDSATGQTVFTMPFAAVAGVEPEPFAEGAGVEPQPFRTGLFGVTAGQTIRVNVLNAGDAAGIIEPCFRIWDTAGNLLFEIAAGPVPGGLGTFVDFATPPVGAVVRSQVRAEVELLPAVHPPEPVRLAALRRRALLTLEVFDTATGRTVYTMPFATVGTINPQPFQTVR